MLDFFTKKENLKWGVLGLIALFMLSTLAQYAGGALSSGPSPSSQTEGQQDYTANAVANMTLISWEPSLEVLNEDERLDDLITRLKEDGKINYDLKLSDRRVLRLSDSDDVFEVSQNLQTEGYILLANAVVRFSNVTVYKEDMSQTTVDAKSTSVTKISPSFQPGDELRVSFTVSVRNGQLFGYSTPLVQSTEIVDFSLVPKSSEVLSTYHEVQLSWANRMLDITPIKEALKDEAEVSLNSKSFILLNPPLTEQQASQLSLSKPDYITNIQLQRLGITPTYNDKDQIASDLLPYSVQPIFENPTIVIEPKQGADVQIKDIVEILDEKYALENANLSTLHLLKIEVPQMITANNSREYFVSNTTLLLESYTRPDEDSKISLSASPIGRRIDTFTNVRYSELDEADYQIDLNDFMIDNDSKNDLLELPNTDYGDTNQTLDTAQIEQINTDQFNQTEKMDEQEKNESDPSNQSNTTDSAQVLQDSSS